MSSTTSNTVQISNIADQTSEEDIRNFFGFWSVVQTNASGLSEKRTNSPLAVKSTILRSMLTHPTNLQQSLLIQTQRRKLLFHLKIRNLVEIQFT
jgi:hypothetical protein